MQAHEQELAQLTARYRMGLTEKQSELALAWERWLSGPDDPGAKDRFQFLVHRLAGSAHSYGYADLGREALRVDELLANWDSEVESLRSPLRSLQSEIAARAETLLHVLSRAAREVSPLIPAAEQVPRGEGVIYVLLVEDDPIQASHWRAALSREGLRVRTVDSRAALEAQLVIEQPDVLLLDFWMPGETAADLARHLRSLGDFSQIPRVCLTADQGQLPRQVAMDSGFTAVVRKTVTPADLAQVLRQAARQARAA